MHPRSIVASMWPLVLLAALAAPPSAAAQTTTVRCESQGGAQVSCAIPSNAQVALARQLSSAPCEQGRTWGNATNYIWVTAGCRADFTVTAYRPEPTPPQVPQPAPAPAGNPAPGPPDQTPGSAYQLRVCRTEADRRLPDYTYDQTRAMIDHREGTVSYIRWYAGPNSGTCTIAANGRILQFSMNGTTGGEWNGGETGGNVGGGTGLPVTSRITCESTRAGRQECRIATGAEVRLVRQISQNPCRLNDTYGVGQGYLWVDKGCRGEFEVTEPGSGGAGGNASVRRIVCESQGAARTQCPAAGVSSIRLIRQISQSPCRLNSSFGTGFGYIWVSNGCRGEFEVTIRNNDNNDNAGPPTSRVTCESTGPGRQHCRIPFKAQVSLVRQLSSAACRQNDTWGVTPNDIWVSKGCRAEFLVRAMAAR